MFKMAEQTNKQIKHLTQEELEKIIQDETEKNNLSEEEIKDVEDILTAVGGMSKRTKRALIGIGSVLGVAALTGIAVYTANKLPKYREDKKIRENYENKHLKEFAGQLSPRAWYNLVMFFAANLKRRNFNLFT